MYTDIASATLRIAVAVTATATEDSTKDPMSVWI